MERMVAVLHGGALAHYLVKSTKDGWYTARLHKYNGKQDCAPPQQFELHKVSRHWEDEGAEQELVNEIGKAIDLSQRSSEGPVDPERARNWGGAPNT